MARRLTKELKEMQKNPVEWATAGPVDDDLMKWDAMLVGPEGSPYAGGVFSVDITFPAEYPFKPPSVQFKTRIYHPNIKTSSGEICADILSENWGPTLNVMYVLNALRQMLEEPHPDNPLESEIAREMVDDPDTFAKKAAEWTATYAS
eukprot:PLAT7376.1.p1 GENE.PLAT7376.1~~PLAT7376.1.p1  ORF type:complete len:148 (-),score=63.59 PLAT7376.1:172-615(-)